MVFVLVVVVVPFGIFATWWAYHFERSVYLVVHRSPGEAAAPKVTRSLGTDRPPADAGYALAVVAAAIQLLEPPVVHACNSVLGWDAFTVTSTLAADGRVLVSCRRQAGDAWPDELTMVLLVGDDHRAERAIGLLERWRAGQASLHLRPTTVAGTIELFDARDNALRAPLLVA